MLGPSVVGALVLVAIIVVVRIAMGELLARASAPFEVRGEERTALAWALTVGVLAVLPYQAALWLGDIRAGALVVAALCAPLAFLAWRRAGGVAFAARVESRAAFAVCAVLGALLAHVALTTYLWDEGSAHFGVPAAIARGALPAVLPLFPAEPFAYHLGYDVLVALVRAFVRSSPAVACDVVTLASIALMLAVCVHVGRALGGERGGDVGAVLTPVLALLGYGATALCLADGWGIGVGCARWFPEAWVSAQRLPPPVVSSFFQHPQGLGAPLLCAALWLGLERRDGERLLLAFGLVALLSQVQVVMAALAWGALLVGACTWGAVERDARIVVRGVVGAALALVAARVLGGLAADTGSLLRFDRGYFDEQGLALLVRNVALLGVCLVAAPLSLVLGRAQRERLPLRLALTAVVVVAFVVPNVARYERSWDIIKFFAVGALAANLLLADAAAQLWSRGLLGRQAVGRALAVVLVLAAVPSGALWLLRHGPLNGVVAARYTESPPSEIARVLDERFGDRIGAARVLTSDPSIHQHGFLVAGHDWRRAEQGYTFDRAHADALTARATRARRSLDRADLDALGVDFVLLSAKDRAALTEDARAVLAAFEHLGDLETARGAFSLYRVRRSL